MSEHSLSVSTLRLTHSLVGGLHVAMFRSPLWDKLPMETKLTPENLSALFARTMEILGEVQENSPVLKMDLKILQNVKRICGI
jgi:hypothetical protein